MKKIILCVLLILGIGLFLSSCKGKNEGTYYLYEDGVYNKKEYYVIEGKKWKDDDGASGSYKIEDNKITLYIVIFGFTEELETGTIEDGVMTLGRKTYCKEGKVPIEKEETES